MIRELVKWKVGQRLLDVFGREEPFHNHEKDAENAGGCCGDHGNEDSVREMKT